MVCSCVCMPGFPNKMLQSGWLKVIETCPSLLSGSVATLSEGSREESVLSLSH